MSVQTIHFRGWGGRGWGLCENQKYFRTLLTFWPDFLNYYHGDFWYSKMLMCTFFGGGGVGSQKVYGLYTHENVDIYGQPLKKSRRPAYRGTDGIF